MIITFRDKATRKIFDGEKIKSTDKALAEKARRRLQLINSAIKVEDLYFPPSNRFHALQGYDPPRYSIRINNQWRISFEWHSDGNAYDVCFEDYH